VNAGPFNLNSEFETADSATSYLWFLGSIGPFADEIGHDFVADG